MAKNNPKLKLFEDDPLVKALKKEHVDIINPFTYNFDDTPSGSLPANKFTFSAVIGEDDDDDTDSTKPVEKLQAPNLEDISVVKSEIYYDQKGVPHARFIFNVKNHVGDDVVGVYGKGG
jgi:hypothetical protein